jgi:YbgC/YbaW family acyl-CoA thioester hydrolase
MWKKRIEIRWRDLDGSRHVNNAVYLSYLEEARSDWLGHVLGGRKPVWEFVLARVEIDFRRELGLDDVAAVVSCRLSRIGTSSIRTAEQIHTARGELAAEAEAVLVAWDQPAGASRPLTDTERAALESEAEEVARDE